jgi:hypothetical protein
MSNQAIYYRNAFFAVAFAFVGSFALLAGTISAPLVA